VAADALLAQGKPVRVIVRDVAKGEPWRAKGAEVAVAALEDIDALTKALIGVEGAYLLLPPNLGTPTPIETAAALVKSLAAAIAAANVPHVVLLSSIGAQHADGTGPIKNLHVAERELAATGTALTAVRAAYFQDNWGSSLGTLASGNVYSFIPNELSFAQVSTIDIGKTVARALVEGAARGTTQVIELAGPRDVSGRDVEATLRTITGKDINVVAAPLDGVVPTFTGFGMSSGVAELFREMYAGLISGHIAFTGKGRTVRGTITIEDTLRRLVG